MALTARGSAAAPSSSLMPALLCVVAAILLWLAAEDARERLAPLQLQTKAATALAKRAGSVQGNEALLKQSAAQAHQERTELERRLLSQDPPQLIRARMVYDLRQRCEASLAQNCNVRLSEDTTSGPTSAESSRSSPVTPAGGKGPARQPVLEDLGIVKSRAIIYGTFQKDELLQITNGLNKDPSAHWRINGVTVKGNVFELDVERHMRTAGAAASPSVAVVASVASSPAAPTRQP